jgi:serine/threonine protein kinase/tetratricopeptide (TPR) repeat protein
MSPERWNQLRSLYDLALDHAPAERLKVLSSQAGADTALVDEVLRMIALDQDAGDFLEESPARQLRQQLAEPQPLFEAGQSVAQRFNVIRLLGSGGMGEVYEAEDTDLGERVALKTLRVDRLADPKAHYRLRREALLARKITHPNVCRIFDILRHQRDGEEFAVLSMEFLPGLTLAAHLKQSGPFTPQAAEPIIRQILAALIAAHQVGVIHRDLKPSNIMLVADRAVVTDFGLAITGATSDAAPLTTLTHSGQLVGTPEYMAPEQIRNQPVTAQSDIYSLGVVMYEMLTGQRPTQGATGLEEVLSRILDAPPSPRSINPSIPRRWEAIILRCLERDPLRRYPSATALLKALNSRWQLPTIPRRALWTGVATASTAGVSVIGYSLWEQRNRSPVNPLLVVTPVAGSEGPFSSLRLLLTRQLEQSSHFKVWNQSAFADLSKSLRWNNPTQASLSAGQWRQLAHRAKGDFVIHNSLTPIAGEYVLNCKLERIGTEAPDVIRQWDRSFRFVSRDRLLDTIQDAANWIRATVGESAESISARDRSPALLTTPSFEALRLFEQAEAIKDDRTAEAISMLREAVRLDSDFAMAWMRLGDLQVAMKDWPNGIGSWRKAATLADTGHLSLAEADRIRTMYAYEIGDLQSAEVAAIRWSKDFPRELRPLWETFQTRLSMGRVAEAESVIPQMAALPNSQRYYCLAQAVSSLWTGDVQKMRNSSIELRNAGATFQGQELLSNSYGYEKDFASAKREAKALLSMKRNQDSSRGFIVNAAISAAESNLDEAEAWLQKGLDFDRSHGLAANEPVKHLGLAYLAWLTKRFDLAKGQCVLAMQKGDPVTMIPECVAILYRCREGRLAESARQRWQMPIDSPRFQRSSHWMHAEKLLFEGRFDAAMEELRLVTALSTKLKPVEPLLHGLAASGQKSAAQKLAESAFRPPAALWYSTQYSPVGTIHFFNEIQTKPKGASNA